MKADFERCKATMKSKTKDSDIETEELECGLQWKLATLSIIVGLPAVVFCYSWFSTKSFPRGILALNVLLVTSQDALGPVNIVLVIFLWPYVC